MARSSGDENIGPSKQLLVEPEPMAPRRRRMRDRVALGHLFMVASALLAFVLALSVLRDRRPTEPVLMASTEILPGTVITADLVETVYLPSDSGLVDSMAKPGSLGANTTAGQRLAPGDPITITALATSSTPSGLRAMSLPIDRVDAVGGDIVAGDRIDVISVTNQVATYVAVDLEVLATQRSESRTGALSSNALTTYYVTVAVDGRDGLALALALEQGNVSVLRSTGAEPVDDAELKLAEIEGPGPLIYDDVTNQPGDSTQDEPDDG